MKLRRSKRLRGLQRPSYYLRSSPKGSSSKGSSSSSKGSKGSSSSSSKGWFPIASEPSKSFATTLEYINYRDSCPYFYPSPYPTADLKPDPEILRILRSRLELIRCPSDEVSLPSSFSVSVPRSIAEGPGLVVGNVVYSDGWNIIDCSKRGTGGTITPPKADIGLVRFCKEETTALFILLVGSPFAFNELARERFYTRFPCVVVTANGAPEFVCKMERELDLPVLAWLNCDPSALEILSFYGRHLNNIKWVGISPKDVLEHEMDKDHLNLTLPMNENEFKTANQLLGDPFVNNHQSWLHELDTMLASKEKAEFEAMPCFGFQYLTNVFLPMKFQRGDWL